MTGSAASSLAWAEPLPASRSSASSVVPPKHGHGSRERDTHTDNAGPDNDDDDDKDNHTPFLSTAAGELAFFRALIEHRPVGVDKHWDMVQVSRSLQRQQERNYSHDADPDANGSDDTGRRAQDPLANVTNVDLWRKYDELYDQDTLWSTWEGEQLGKMEAAGLLPPTPDESEAEGDDSKDGDSPTTTAHKHRSEPPDPSVLCMQYRFPPREFTLVPHHKTIARQSHAWDEAQVADFSERIAKRAKRTEGDPDSPPPGQVTPFTVEVPDDWTGYDDDEDDEQDEQDLNEDGNDKKQTAPGNKRKQKTSGGPLSPKERGARSRATTKAATERAPERAPRRRSGAATKTTATSPRKRTASNNNSKAGAADDAEDHAQAGSGDDSGSDLSELDDEASEADDAGDDQEQTEQDGDDVSESRASDNESVEVSRPTKRRRRTTRSESVPTSEATSVMSGVDPAGAVSAARRTTARVRRPKVKEDYEMDTPTGSRSSRRKVRVDPGLCRNKSG